MQAATILMSCKDLLCHNGNNAKYVFHYKQLFRAFQKALYSTFGTKAYWVINFPQYPTSIVHQGNTL